MILIILCIAQATTTLYQAWDANRREDPNRHLLFLAISHAWLIAAVFAGDHK